MYFFRAEEEAKQLNCRTGGQSHSQEITLVIITALKTPNPILLYF
jgi:hypothetical protein